MVKNLKKTFALILLALTIGITALAYNGIIFPAYEDAKTQKNLELLKEALENGNSESLEAALGKVSDDVLLSTILESAIYLEETGSESAMALFVPEAMKRITAKVTPDNLFEIYTDAYYPEIFKTFIMELTLYAHTKVDEKGEQHIDENYKVGLAKIISDESLVNNDYLLHYALQQLSKSPNITLLEKVLVSEHNTPQAKRFALEAMTRAEPAKMKPQLYAAAANFENLDNDMLKGVLSSMLDMMTTEPELYSDAPEVAFNTLKAYMECDPRREIPEGFEYDSYNGHFSESMISFVGKIVGEGHYPGFVEYIYSVKELVPNMPFAMYIMSSQLFYEVDELLLTSNGGFLDFLLDIIERNPYKYYEDTLKILIEHDIEEYQVGRINELLKLIEEEAWPPVRWDLATKEGDWSE